MSGFDARLINGLNKVAMGEGEADLLLRDCALVSVYTGEILHDTDVAIYGGKIAYVGPDGSHTAGPRTITEDLGGRYLAPGLVDPHMHTDQFCSPFELASRLALHGTTSVFTDPIDMVCVGGYRGFADFVRMSRNLPVRFFHTIPGGLPVDARLGGGRQMSEAESKSALKLSGVMGMGEVFSWTKVTMRDPKTMRYLALMLDENRIINGHTAGMSGKKLNAYACSGISSCHEPIDYEQLAERLRLGMWVMMREGTIRRDLKDMMPGLLESAVSRERLMFCSDGVDPIHLENLGHIDHCIREAVRLGLDVTEAITMASRHCFEYYGLKWMGGIAPGQMADIIILDDMKSMIPTDVYLGGRRTVKDGRLVFSCPPPRTPAWMRRTVKVGKFTPFDFEVRAKRKNVQVNAISMLTEIITEQKSVELESVDGNVRPCRDDDIWKVAAFERVYGTGRGTVGFLANFGADVGALASTWTFHENDLIVIGADESDMALAANELARVQGGIIIVRDGEVLSLMPLRLCGIASEGTIDEAAACLAHINDTLKDAGSKFPRPHRMTLFLPFLALPSVRITHRGVIDVRRRAIMPVVQRAGSA